jgi:Biotin-lipoyl like
MGRLRSFSGPGFGHFFELVRGESGVVRAIDVVDGAHVEAGQVLVELDCEPLRMEIDVRAASLAAAVAVYERVVNGPRPEEIAIGEAGVGVALAPPTKRALRWIAPTGWRSASPSPSRNSWSPSVTPASPTRCSWTRARSLRCSRSAPERELRAWGVLNALCCPPSPSSGVRSRE